MKKQIFSILVLSIGILLPFSLHSQEQRKKVGVVLSGGGAKGMAHIKALKVIEEAGIPIDYIAGTSMGAIVGGLYAIGYTTEQLDSMVRKQDWTFLLSDRIKRSAMSLTDRERSEKYTVSIPFTKTPKDAATGVNTPDEELSVTLIEGKLKVNAPSGEYYLLPGEHSLLHNQKFTK